MNFFRKANIAYISLSAQDLEQEPQALWRELTYVFEGFSPETARLRLNECDDIALDRLAVLAGLAQKLAESGSGLELEGSRKLLTLIRKLNLSVYFKTLTEVA